MVVWPGPTSPSRGKGGGPVDVVPTLGVNVGGRSGVSVRWRRRGGRCLGGGGVVRMVAWLGPTSLIGGEGQRGHGGGDKGAMWWWS